MNVIVDFSDLADAKRCLAFVRERYPGATVKRSACDRRRSAENVLWTWTRWHSLAITDVVGFENQCAIAFIKGFASALGDKSHIPAVMCRGDERETT
jgi:hypothetical protein